MQADQTVNPHFLQHVLATAATHGLKATEDITANNGMKLVAKGSRIQAGMRERLLQHKLRKPLEQCVQVVSDDTGSRLGAIAQNLLDTHGLLRTLCAAPETSVGTAPVLETIAGLPLSAAVRSLLTMYSGHQDDRMAHTVGVAMLALGLARRLLPGEIERQQSLAVAGLLHDVGELYIDPLFLRRDAPLQPDQWRHIAAHPLIGHHVLQDLDGAGKAVAQAVLQHHERLDGFGYPRGVAGTQLSLDGQIVGAAEWLMALAESGVAPVARASIASKLMPGGFHPALLDAISCSARTSDELLLARLTPMPLTDLAPRVARISGALKRFAQHRGWINKQIANARGSQRGILQRGQQRMLRIQSAFSSTGLDTGAPELLLREIAALDEPQLHLEVATIVDELLWRLRELERESLLRGAMLSRDENAVVCELVERLRGRVYL